MRYIFFGFINVLVAVITQGSLFAQENIVIEDININYKIWKPEDGLQHWYIGGLYYDSDNLIWIQNKNEILIFDGHNFFSIDKIQDDLNIFPKASFLKDRNGIVWVLQSFSKKNILKCIDPNGFTQIEPKNILGEKNLRILEEKEVDFIRKNGDLVELYSDGIQKGHFEFNEGLNTVYPKYVENHALTNKIPAIKIEYDEESKFRIDENLDIYIENIESWVSISLKNNKGSIKLVKDHKEADLLDQINQRSKNENEIFVKYIGKFPQIFSVYVGNKFFFPLKGVGLLEIDLSNIYFKNLLPQRSIRNIELVNDSILFASSAVEAPVIYKVNLNSHKTDEIEIPFGVYSILKDGNDIWLGNRKNVLGKSDRLLKNIKVWPNDEIYDEIRAPTKINDSLIYFGTTSSLFQFNVLSEKYRKILSDVSVNCIYKDSSDRIWLGTNNGLLNLNENKWKFEKTKINSIGIDLLGDFVLSTNNGLVIWNEDRDDYDLLNIESGLASNNIHTVYFDSKNNYWLSTNGGISFYDLNSKRIVNFGKKSGLNYYEMNYDAYASNPNNGDVYFGGLGGIYAFNPKKINVSNYNVISDNMLIAFQEELNKDGTVDHVKFPGKELLINKNSIQTKLQFSFPNFNVNFQKSSYRINEISSSWVDFNLYQPLVINNLPSGKYQLNIKIEDVNSGITPTIYDFYVIKQKFLYQQTLFKILFLLTIVGVLYLLYRIRIKLLRKAKVNLEKKVEKRTQIIKQQKLELVRQTEIRNQMFNNVSHDFKTPLSVIKGLSQLIKTKEKKTGWVDGYLMKIENQTDNLLSMVDDLINLSNLEQGLVNIKLSKINWNNFFLKLCNEFKPLAEIKNIKCSIENYIPVNMILYLDNKKLEYIIQNLISNALKFTDKNGTINISSNITDSYLEIKVQDSGIGIEEEFHSKIFKRYFQINHPNHPYNEGYGIGLSICKDYIDLMNGKISVESIKNVGSEFLVSIPIKGEKIKKEVKANQNNKSTILLVEDNNDLRILYLESLSLDFNVIECSDGTEAMDILRDRNNIDLIISDVYMPVMDGFKFLELIKRDEKFKFIPFLMITAYNSDQIKLKALKKGADDIIFKPFNIEFFIEKTRTILKNEGRRKKFILNLSEEEKSEITYSEEWNQKLNEILSVFYGDPDFGVQGLAKKLFLTERSLYNKVFSNSGLTPSNYIRKYRLEISRELILNKSNWSIKEIALKSGFKDVRYFSKIFKNEFGDSPSKLKNEQ